MPPSHSSARDDGRRRNTHVRVVLSSAVGQGGRTILQGIWERTTAYVSNSPQGLSLAFSSTEIEHLTVATIAFTEALGFAFGGGIGGAVLNLPGYLMLCSLLLIAIAPAFVIHEMAHKISQEIWLLGRVQDVTRGPEIRGTTRCDPPSRLHGPRSGHGYRQYNKAPVRQDCVGRTGIEPLPLGVGDCPIGG